MTGIHKEVRMTNDGAVGNGLQLNFNLRIYLLFIYFLVIVRKKRRSGVMHCDYLKV